ncbi:MAG: RNA-binding protein [Deltaproteobacteria bacterium]|nr:RNA-binding protein [Deltaproteobacteria bacterium]
MNKKLYVGNLPYSSTEDELKEMFGKIGSVESVSIITDRFSGKSKGFGFVQMASEDDASKAISELSGQEIGGRKIIVSEARTEGERKGGGFHSKGRGGFRGRRNSGGNNRE